MNRQQWVVVALVIFLVVVALIIGLIIWSRQRNVVIVEPQPTIIDPVPVPIVAGKAQPVTHIKRVTKTPTSTGATYRQTVGKKA